LTKAKAGDGELKILKTVMEQFNPFQRGLKYFMTLKKILVTMILSVRQFKVIFRITGRKGRRQIRIITNYSRIKLTLL
jgi:heme exporter protein D